MRVSFRFGATSLIAIVGSSCIGQSLHDLSPDRAATLSKSECAAVIRHYESDTNRWPETNYLSLAIVFESEGRYRESTNLLGRYLRQRPADARALRNLGASCLVLKANEQAAKALELSWSLGDAESLAALAGAYVALGKRSKVDELIPPMLRMNETATGSLKRNLVQILVIHAVTEEPFNKRVFLQSIEGLSNAEMLRNEGAKYIIDGLELAGEKERAKALRVKFDEQKR